MAYENSLAGASHAMFGIMLFEAFETREDGGILLGLGFFGAEGVVREGVEADGLGLVPIEGLRKNGRVGGLDGGGSYGRHLGLSVYG
jgi:hypothetical protein